MSERHRSPLPDSRSLKRLYEVLARAPANVAAIQCGEFRVEFRAPQAAVVQPRQEHARPVDLVPGTPFPNDDSPLNPIDLVLFPPPIGHEAS